MVWEESKTKCEECGSSCLYNEEIFRYQCTKCEWSLDV